MVQVTGYTAERMKEIEDSCIVDGDIVAGDLILTRFDASTTNAGPITSNPLRDTTANLAASNPVVAAGRLAMTTDGTPRLLAMGDGVTAWNSLPKFWDNRGPSWVGYTSTISQGASTNISKTTSFSEYLKQEKLITWNFNFVFTAGGTAGSPVRLTLPVNAASGQGDIGRGSYWDAAPGTKFDGVWTTDGSTIILYSGNIASGGGAAAGQNPAFTVASTDGVSGSVVYKSV